jgi:hypothetical protein
VASRLKPSKVAPQDIAAALLMGVLLIWPFRQGIRYAFPVVPLYFFYVLTGALALEGRLKLRGFPVIKGLLGAALLIYAIRIGTDGIGPKQIGIATPASQQLLDWTRRNTLQSELIVASKSRAISYLTGRRTALGGVPGKVDLPQYLTEVGATYVIIGLPDAALFDASVRAHSSMFEKRFKNAEYEVFRWKGNVDSALALQMSSAVAR